MAVTTATFTSTNYSDFLNALEGVENYTREASVGGPGRAQAWTLALDTAGTATFTVPARGGNPAYVRVVSASVA